MDKIRVLAPFDGSLIDELELAGENEARAALACAHACYLDRKNWPAPVKRIAILERTAELIAERAEDLARDAAREGGKPLVDSRVEIARAIEGVKIAVREIWQAGGKEVPMGMTTSSAGRIAHTYREPRGVVLAISAFNHPFNLIVHQVVTAVAAGCPVVVKPALTTPVSCRNLVNILHEAGLPPEWCRMILVPDEVAGKMVEDRHVAFLTFIGSATVGWTLRSKLPPGAACALEHGGVAPAIVDGSADIDDAVPLLAKGGFYHAGQVCVSVQRIYVEESVAEEFTAKFVMAAKGMHVGDPLDESTEVGPLILPGEVDRVHRWVEEAITEGGKLLCGGKKVSDSCYEPTVVLDPPDDVMLSTAEIFGPVVAIYTFRDVEDAIRRANGPDTFFQASIFTSKLDRALDLSRRINGTAVMVNDHTAFRVDWMPFGGHRQSGLGIGGIGQAMHDMTIERMVVFREFRSFGDRLRNPPRVS